MTVREARKVLTNEEAGKLIDMDEVGQEAVLRAEEGGIIFIDEIDKIAKTEGFFLSRCIERRSKRYPSDCRRIYRRHEIRLRQDRSRAVYRSRGIPYGQTV